MKVYAVLRGEYDNEGIDEVFASRELAEQYLGTDLRRRYDKLYRDAGKPIPRQGYKDGSGGIVPQTRPHPGSFDEWCKTQERGYVEEYEVLDSLPAG